VAERDKAHDDLDTKIVRGSAWAVLGYGGTQVLSLVTMLVLTRLLLPEEFGVVALAIAVLAVAQIAQESGLGAALIVYRGELRPAAASVLVFSPVAALGLYVACFLAAPIAAWFFHEPQLTEVIRVLGLVLVLRGLTIMPLSLLERDLRFGPITAGELAAGIAQAAVAIGAALAGAGLWSLVLGQLAFALVKVVLAWVYAPLRPSPFEAERATLRELMRYGRHVGAANLINYGNANSEGIVVGRALGATDLGYYAIAARLGSMPVNVLGNILGRGVFAALARVRADAERFRAIWVENLQRLALFSVPAAIGIALVAEPLVLTLLGPTWKPAIVPLQLLALSSVVRTFSATAGEVFQAAMRPRLRVLSESVYLVLIVPSLVVGARGFGLTGAAASVLLVNVVFGLGLLYGMTRLTGLRVRELLRALARPAIGWGLLTLSVLAARPAVDGLSSAGQLVVLTSIGAAVYCLGLALLARDLVATMWVSLRGARTSG
jgi:O-antigen/teichoic acid export membrane protein